MYASFKEVLELCRRNKTPNVMANWSQSYNEPILIGSFL